MLFLQLQGAHTISKRIVLKNVINELKRHLINFEILIQNVLSQLKTLGYPIELLLIVSIAHLIFCDNKTKF